MAFSLCKCLLSHSTEAVTYARDRCTSCWSLLLLFKVCSSTAYFFAVWEDSHDCKSALVWALRQIIFLLIWKFSTMIVKRIRTCQRVLFRKSLWNEITEKKKKSWEDDLIIGQTNAPNFLVVVPAFDTCSCFLFTLWGAFVIRLRSDFLFAFVTDKWEILPFLLTLYIIKIILLSFST